ncbi:hypothetical protein PRIPAC_90670 [Pristionchus pacificus]|uniref:Uncharacterized protein n=1 Tax=Pristionchus pacificus TaxID=54126 RepID=A0A2A6CYB4_PRIPA|nr:hypothetical protein PRIPAC_90670 [Pristionchus pacificus]|eukprot:PDM83057.1 hypothetical protein PRIPAC_37450 [Pristionchus pacificus]
MTEMATEITVPFGPNISDTRCNTQCEGSVCNETCTNLCNTFFTYSDHVECVLELERYTMDLNNLLARYDKEYELFLAEFHRLHDSFETTIDKKFIKFGLEHIDFSIFKNKSMIL